MGIRKTEDRSSTGSLRLKTVAGFYNWWTGLSCENAIVKNRSLPTVDPWAGF
jgi:hypothetical protein